MPAATASGQPSVLEDLVDILYQPAIVFERRREFVAFGLAMVILAALTAVVYFATRSGFEPVLDAMAKQQLAEIMRQNPEIKEAQLGATAGMIKMGTVATILAYPLIAPLLIGLLLWVAGKFLESKAAIGAAIMVATYSYVPRLIGFVISSLLAVLLPEDQVTSFFSISLSPARFLDPGTTSIAVLGALARLDLFLIWQTALCGIGISVLGGISRGRGLVVAVVVWALGFLPLLPALIRG
jgi:hypothetical protein